MAEQVVDVMVEAGKATAGPPLGPALGPLGINIGQVVAEINKATASFKGMQVPVKVIVDTDTKQFKIEVGTPPTSSLIKKALNIETGAKKPGEEFVGSLTLQQVVEIAKSKNLLGKTLKEKVKTIAGTAQSMGVKIEDKPVQEFLKDLDSGFYDEKLASFEKQQA